MTEEVDSTYFNNLKYDKCQYCQKKWTDHVWVGEDNHLLWTPICEECLKDIAQTIKIIEVHPE